LVVAIRESRIATPGTRYGLDRRFLWGTGRARTSSSALTLGGMLALFPPAPRSLGQRDHKFGAATTTAPTTIRNDFITSVQLITEKGHSLIDAIRESRIATPGTRYGLDRRFPWGTGRASNILVALTLGGMLALFPLAPRSLGQRNHKFGAATTTTHNDLSQACN
jgi:hypothetical protein